MQARHLDPSPTLQKVGIGGKFVSFVPRIATFRDEIRVNLQDADWQVACIIAGMKQLGIALICLGLLGFVLSTVSFTSKEKVVDLGPLEVSKDKKESIPVPPILSGVILASGVVVLLVGQRRAL